MEINSLQTLLILDMLALVRLSSLIASLNILGSSNANDTDDEGKNLYSSDAHVIANDIFARKW